MCRLAGTDSCCGCLLRICFCDRDSKEGGRVGNDFRFEDKRCCPKAFGMEVFLWLFRKTFSVREFFFFFSLRGAVEVDDKNLRIRVQIDILIVRQVADACHVFARFVDVRLAKLFVE